MVKYLKYCLLLVIFQPFENAWSQDDIEIYVNDSLKKKYHAELSIAARFEGKIRDIPDPTGNQIMVIKEKDTIVVDGFYDGYWKIKCKGTCGYINEVFFNENPLLNQYKEEVAQGILLRKEIIRQREIKQLEETRKLYAYTNEIFDNKVSIQTFADDRDTIITLKTQNKTYKVEKNGGLHLLCDSCTITDYKNGYLSGYVNFRKGILKPNGQWLASTLWSDVEAPVFFLPEDGMIRFSTVGADSARFKLINSLVPDHRISYQKGMGFIDTSFTMIIAPVFDYASDFRNGIAIVKVKDEYFLVNKKGERINELTSKDPIKVDHSLVIQQGEKTNLFDMKGKFLASCFFAGKLYENKRIIYKDTIAHSKNKKFEIWNEKNICTGKIQTYLLTSFNKGKATAIDFDPQTGITEYYSVNEKGKRTEKTLPPKSWDFNLYKNAIQTIVDFKPYNLSPELLPDQNNMPSPDKCFKFVHQRDSLLLFYYDYNHKFTFQELDTLNDHCKTLASVNSGFYEVPRGYLIPFIKDEVLIKAFHAYIARFNIFPQQSILPQDYPVGGLGCHPDYVIEYLINN